MGVPLGTKLDSTLRYDADTDKYGVAPGVIYLPASIHVPPALIGQTADPDDEECDGTTISAAWRTYLNSSHALVTPGPCTPWNSSANTMRWDQGIERPSCLTLEAPYGDGFLLTKPLAPLTTANGTPRWVAYARCILAMRHARNPINGTMPEGVFVYQLFKDNAGVPDWANHVDITVFPYWEASGGPSVGLYFDSIIAGEFTRVWSHEITGSASAGAVSYGDRTELSKFGFFHDGAGGVGAFFGDEWTQIMGSSGTAGPISVPFNFGHVGILQLRGINIAPASHCHVDYFRIRRPDPSAPASSSPRLP